MNVKEWKKQFDEAFYRQVQVCSHCGRETWNTLCPRCGSNYFKMVRKEVETAEVDKEAVISLIDTLLDEVKLEKREMHIYPEHPELIDDDIWSEGWNEAVAELNAKIEKIKQELKGGTDGK